MSFLSVFSSPGPIVFEYGPFSIRWYGILIAIAVLIGLNLSSKLGKSRKIERDTINDLLPFLVIGALIGARLYYVIFEWQKYKYNLIESIAIWKGGIAIHGALIGGVFAIWIYCIIRKYYFWDLLDILVPSFALGQSIGRWGNFFNNEAFGRPTELPWKLFIPYIDRPLEFISFDYFHPTFLYESIWNLIIFLLLIFLLKKNEAREIELRSGVLTSIYLIFYSIGRFWIESIRIDPLCISAMPPSCQGGVRIAQVMSLFLITLGSLSLWWIYKRKRLPSLGTKKRTSK